MPTLRAQASPSFYPEGKVSRVQNLQMSTQEATTSPSAASAATLTTPRAPSSASLPIRSLPSAWKPPARCFRAPTLSMSAVWYRRSSTTLPPMRSCCAPALSSWRRRRVLCAHRQLWRYLGRLLRQAHGPARRPSSSRERQEQRACRLPDHRRLRPQPSVLHDHFAVDGHPHQLQPRAHALLPVRRRLRARCRLMEQLAQTGRYEVPAELLAKIQSVFGCGWASEDEVRAAIKSCWDANGT